MNVHFYIYLLYTYFDTEALYMDQEIQLVDVQHTIYSLNNIQFETVHSPSFTLQALYSMLPHGRVYLFHFKFA